MGFPGSKRNRGIAKPGEHGGSELDDSGGSNMTKYEVHHVFHIEADSEEEALQIANIEWADEENAQLEE